ncbi:hypothetical protein FNV43_RR21229 [Rhamnella rubrinervis]|uniref:Uncharacterized protein n=1 Tax=Rhamnella rubrinervis TaxID=2594499 RepID=A0A8K0DVV6_9ROSA|nr:hypothetical protein FNV43_RR21229 [Rhamnella rubrinervis]
MCETSLRAFPSHIPSTWSAFANKKPQFPPPTSLVFFTSSDTLSLQYPSRQLTPNSWQYLLGLIILLETCGLYVDMATFLPHEAKQRRQMYPLRSEANQIIQDAPTSDKNWKDCYFFIKYEGLFSPIDTSESKVHSAWTKRDEGTSEQQAEQNFEDANPSNQQVELILEGIPLPILEVSYLHVLEGYIRLLCGGLIDPLWASYPIADISKLKMKMPFKAQLKELQKKKKEKKNTQKGGRPPLRTLLWTSMEARSLCNRRTYR